MLCLTPDTPSPQDQSGGLYPSSCKQRRKILPVFSAQGGVRGTQGPVTEVASLLNDYCNFRRSGRESVCTGEEHTHRQTHQLTPAHTHSEHDCIVLLYKIIGFGLRHHPGTSLRSPSHPRHFFIRAMILGLGLF